CEEGAFTPEEMEIYDQYWDRISTEKGLNWQFRKDGLAEGRAEGRVEGEAKGLVKGLAKGRAEGLAKGHAEGLAEGEAKALEKIVLSAYQNKLSIEQIQAFSGLSKDAIHKILNGDTHGAIQK
ncbi:MAG: hypothetical protein LBF08_03000, partial [Dysgonamonadaceae bacterium]|nr:hypothetical protein [Dysgonamonadaceae bacterium]